MCRELFFFFNDTATTEIYTLSLHDALPISPLETGCNTWFRRALPDQANKKLCAISARAAALPRSEEHTSELQSRQYLVCRLLLEKKKKTQKSRASFTKRLHTSAHT